MYTDVVYGSSKYCYKCLPGCFNYHIFTLFNLRKNICKEASQCENMIVKTLVGTYNSTYYTTYVYICALGYSE